MLFFLWITWDIDWEEAFANFVPTKLIRNDSKIAQAKRDAFYKKQSFTCSRLFFDEWLDCMICSQPIKDDEMAIDSGMCGKH